MNCNSGCLSSGFDCSFCEKGKCEHFSTYNPDIEIEKEKDLIIEKFQSIDSKIYNRLKELRKWDFDPDCEDEKMSLDSLKNFYNFCLEKRFKIYPVIASNPQGNIYLEWHRDKRILLGIEFLRNNYVSYVLFIGESKTYGTDKLDDLNVIMNLKGISIFF